MKGLRLLIFIVVFCLVISLLIPVLVNQKDSEYPKMLFSGVLLDVEYKEDGGFSSWEAWVLTFEQGKVMTFHKQPLTGWNVGKKYEIWQVSSIRLKVFEASERSKYIKIKKEE